MALEGIPRQSGRNHYQRGARQRQDFCKLPSTCIQGAQRPKRKWRWGKMVGVLIGLFSSGVIGFASTWKVMRSMFKRRVCCCVPRDGKTTGSEREVDLVIANLEK